MDKLEEEMARAIAGNHGYNFDAISEPERNAWRSDAQACAVIARKRVEELGALISEESIEAIATDIACAVMDPREDVVAMRHSAMVRLGERLRQPLKRDKARAALHRKGVEPK